MEYRCVECGSPIKTLFVQYSLGNIRLMKCENCKAVADEYIECEFMIILIDLILHKPKAYRHLLYNVLYQETLNFEDLLWKSLFGFIFLDAYRSLLLNRYGEGWNSSTSVSFLPQAFQKILVDIFIGNFIFLGILLATMNWLKISARVSRYKDLLLAILVSSSFKIFLIAMMVWEFPSSVIFIIDLFVLSSNTVALKVISDSAMNKCIGACFCGHAAKLLATQFPKLGSLRF